MYVLHFKSHVTQKYLTEEAPKCNLYNYFQRLKQAFQNTTFPFLLPPSSPPSSMVLRLVQEWTSEFPTCQPTEAGLQQVLLPLSLKMQTT